VNSLMMGFKEGAQTWRQHSADARLRAERKRIHRLIREHFDALVDVKARALKSTGVFPTTHENLESALMNLARALEDYLDSV
jgi:hypothetical protein